MATQLHPISRAITHLVGLEGEALKEELEYVIWERTAYPMTNDLKTLYKSLSSYYRAWTGGIRLCEWCVNKALPGSYNCSLCEAAVQAFREKRRKANEDQKSQNKNSSDQAQRTSSP